MFMPPNHLGHLIDISSKQMIWNYLRELCEPEARKRSEYFAFSFDRRGDHAIEGRDAVGSNDQEASIVDFIDIANFAPANKFEIGDRGFNYGGDGGHYCISCDFQPATCRLRWTMTAQLRQQSIKQSKKFGRARFCSFTFALSRKCAK